VVDGGKPGVDSRHERSILQKPSPLFFMVHLLHRLYGIDVLPVAVGCTLYLTDYQVKLFRESSVRCEIMIAIVVTMLTPFIVVENYAAERASGL